LNKAHDTSTDTGTGTSIGTATTVGMVSANTGVASFPKTARLLKTDEFSSVFRLRPWARSAHFVLYGRRREPMEHGVAAARLGVVVGKKQAPRAVTRNLIKRIARETFRLNSMQLAGWDVLIRLSAKFDRKVFGSASSDALNAVIRTEVGTLVERAVREAARHAAPLPAPGG
jgi:ribonuclease P protein component